MSRLGGAVFEWDVERVLFWLKEEGLTDCIKSFKAHKICGRALLNLTEFDIKSLQISPESKRKLQRVLHKVKSKKKSNMKKFDGGNSMERRRPNSVTENSGEVDSASDDGWGSDEFDSDEEHSDSEGEYIEPDGEPDELPSSQVSSGLVAQLRDGLSKRLSFSSSRQRCPYPVDQPDPFDEVSEDIYDMPPDEDDPKDGPTAIYDDPNDDTCTSSDIIIQPQTGKKAIITGAEKGEYIHARGEERNRGFQAVPPKPVLPSRRFVPPPPASEETYDAPEELPGPGPDMYEMPGHEPAWPQQDTYEIPGQDCAQEQETYEEMGQECPQGQETYEVPGQEISKGQETYEMPVQEDNAIQETYEIPEPSPGLPPRVPKGSQQPAKQPPASTAGKLFSSPRGATTMPTQPTVGPQSSSKPAPARPNKHSAVSGASSQSDASADKSRPVKRLGGHGTKWPPVKTGLPVHSQDIPPKPVNRSHHVPHRPTHSASKPVNSSDAMPHKPVHSASTKPVNSSDAMPHRPPHSASKPMNSSDAMPHRPAHSASKPVNSSDAMPHKFPRAAAKPVLPKTGITGSSPQNPPKPAAQRSPPKPSESCRIPSHKAAPFEAINAPQTPPPRPSKGEKALPPTPVQKNPCTLPPTPGRSVPVHVPKKPQPAISSEQQPMPPTPCSKPGQGGTPLQPTLPPRDHPRKPPEPSLPRRLPSETDSMNSEESGSGDVPLIPVSQLTRLPSKKRLPHIPPIAHQTPSNTLGDAPWFHGSVDRKVAEKSLKACGKDGTFIVRTSTKDVDGYSMSLLYQREVRHLRIPRVENQYILGDSGTKKFGNLIDLVNFYRQNQVDLRKGGSTKLTVHCPKYD